MRKPLGVLLVFCAVAGLALGQRYGRGFWGGGESPVGPDVRTAREIPSHSTGTPEWENPKGFEGDVFTFTRIRYTSGRRGYYGRRGGSCSTDCPDSDLNLSYRLQQMTSIKC
ncbi:MAG: transmembrane prediction, partial [Opitutaceae bacterium]